MATQTVTLLDTERYEDARLCGYDAPLSLEEGGMLVTYERGPTLTIILPDHEAFGLSALEQLEKAVSTAVRLARAAVSAKAA